MRSHSPQRPLVRQRRRSARRAFTLVEALVAVTLMSVSGTALLLGVSSSIQVTEDTVDRTIAQGMAEQLMDEILGKRYMSIDGDPQQYPMCPNSYEMAGVGRSRYDDLDDYHQFRSKPAADPYAIMLGQEDGQGGTRHANFRVPNGYFNNWQQQVDLYYVSESNLSTKLSGSQTSYYRVIEVRILVRQPSGGDIELARLQRVVAYVPEP